MRRAPCPCFIDLHLPLSESAAGGIQEGDFGGVEHDAVPLHHRCSAIYRLRRQSRVLLGKHELRE